VIQDEVLLLTGGAGFIGSHLATRLVERNEVRILDTGDRDALGRLAINEHPNLRRIQGSVLDANALREAMRGCDRVIHLASVAGVDTVLNNPVRTMRVAFEGTLRVIEVAQEVGGIKRIVTFSTSEVFGRFALNAREDGETPIGPVGEPRWTYAVSKVAAEHLAHAYGREFGTPVVTLRPFNVYGPGQVGEGAIHNFVKRALEGTSIVVNNDGRQLRAWCYIDDMVEATLLATEREEAVGHAFNIGDPTSTLTVLRLAELVKRIAGSETPITFVRKDYPDVEVRVPDIDKARRLLGYAPKVALEDGIERTIAWYRERSA